jgi:hypothetical protein
MSENSITTNTTMPEQVANMQKLPALLEANIPKMQKRLNKALAVLDTIGEIPDDDDEAYEDAVGKLAAVRDVYKANTEMRMEMTSITDAFKDMVMVYERDLDPKSPKSKYNAKKKFIEDHQQRKTDRINREKAEQAKRKDAENLKVDIRTHILNNLANMLATGITKADTGSKEFFDASTLETFDTRAESYKGMKPKLKQDDYDKCFACNDELAKRGEQLFEAGEFTTLTNELQQTETYDKWNKLLLEKVGPIINEWRARIPDIKKQKQEMFDAQQKGAAEAETLRKKQQEEENTRQQERQKQIDKDAEEQRKQNEKSANLDKMSNDFAEQGVVQTLGDAGKTKLVLKFSDPKLAPKALMEIMYHVMSSPKFQETYPVFQNRNNKTKALIFDEKKRPEYIDAVQWFIDFFLANCNAEITGTVITEDSKIVIRK